LNFIIESDFFAIIISLSLFLGMIILLQLGHFLGCRANRQGYDKISEGFGTIHGALFALLGLLIAFTFSGAYDRFDHRRQLIVEEANAIGTAYLRLDLLPPEDQSLLREKFLAYVNSRIALYQKLIDKVEALKELEITNKLQREIWNLSVKSTQTSKDRSAPILLLPALNQMIDITTTRKNSILTHAPVIIFIALINLALTCAFLAGIGMAKSPTMKWIHAVLFCGITAFVIYLILDIEYPRYGIVRLEKANSLLLEIRDGMQQRF
jgi:hypothetical protein